MSHVALEQAVCPVCGTTHDTGVLLDKQLREDAFTEHAVTTHIDMCPQHKEMFDNGYIGLVGVDPEKSEGHNERLKPENAFRTGRVMHVKKEAAAQIFNVEIKTPFVYVEDEVIDLLKKRMLDEAGIDLDHVRDRVCMHCKFEWTSNVEYSKDTTNLSGEKTAWCPECGSKAVSSGPMRGVDDEQQEEAE